MINKIAINVVNFVKYNDEVKYNFERKTIKDLANSIKDNRYHEQKQRLINSISSNIKTSYIFESFRNYESLTNDIKICDLNGAKFFFDHTKLPFFKSNI